MENKNFKTEVAKMRSLMERMNGKMTPYESMLNEEKMINEALKSRIQVSRDEILDLLDKADEQQNETNRGLFATFTYVKPATLLKTKRSIDSEKLGSALNKYQDKREEQWHKDLSSFKDAEKSTTKNPITSIITVTRYHIRWQSPANYGKDYSVYRDALSNLRMRNGLGLQSDGMLGDNHNQRQSTDATGAGKVNQTGNFARDFNMMKQHSKAKSVAYLVNAEGNIVSEIPNDIMWSIHQKKSSGTTVEKEAREKLDGEALEKYIKDKAELDATFKGKNFLFDQILCICCSVEGKSYYYINDKLISKIAKDSEVYVNQTELLNIAKEQLGESFDVIQGFAN